MPYKDKADKAEWNRLHKDDKQEWQRRNRAKKRLDYLEGIDSRSLRGIGDRYTEEELKAIAKGKGINKFALMPPKIKIDQPGKEIRFGFFTDTHMSSIFYHESFLTDFIHTCEKKNAQFCIFGGDLTHGMDPRKYNLLYELKHIGYA